MRVCACLQVEYLHALVYQALDLISSQRYMYGCIGNEYVYFMRFYCRKLAHASSLDDQGRDADISYAAHEAEKVHVYMLILK